MHSMKLTMIAVFCAAVFVGYSFTDGGIVVDSQQRQVHIDGQAINTELVVPMNGIPFDQTQTAGDFAAFSQTLSATSSAPPGNNQSPIVLATASASQDSTLTSDGQTLHLMATGSVLGDTGLGSVVNTASSYSVVFTIDSPVTWTLNESRANPTSPVPSVTNIGAQFFAGSPGALIGPSMTPDLQGGTVRGIVTPQFFSGSLQPGTYTFEGQAIASPFEEEVEGVFSVDFTVTTADAASVPLPNAGLAGSGTLALLVGAGLIRRDRSRYA